MSRRAILALAAVVVTAVGIPVAIAALGGGDDERAQPGRTVYPEGIDAQNAPQDQVSGDDDEPAGRAPRKQRGEGGGRPQGPPRDYPTAANVAYPNDVTRSGGEIARVIEGHLGAVAPKAEQLTLIGADCRPGGACSARYVSGPHGGGRILHDAATMLRRMFARRAVRSVTLYVHEPHGRRSRSVEAMALMVIRCDRRDHPGFAWSALNTRNIDSRCRIAEQSPGKLGAQIRKGRLSERDASRGRDAGSGGHAGATQGPDAPPGAKPTGSPAPRTVNRGRGGDGR